MKMESINGGILPIVKMSDGKHEEDDDEDEMLDEEAEEPENKKRKITRKKRSLNWEEAERALLVEIIKPKVEYVENRSVDSNSSKAKRLAWIHITKQFNALNFRHRALEQIQVQWRSMKVFAKKEFKDKSSKGGTLEGLELLEFMEQMHQEPVVTRSQNRGGSVVEKLTEHEKLTKKEEPPNEEEINAPSSNEPAGNASPNREEPHTQTTSQSTLPSPPLSELQLLDNQFDATALNDIKNQKKTASQQIQQRGSRTRRPRTQIPFQNDAAAASVAAAAATAAAAAADDQYKRELFSLMKQARVCEMDYAKREHEERIKLLQLEQELKLECYRKEEDLKMQLMKEEHDARMLHSKLEHEAKMLVWSRYKSTHLTNQKQIPPSQ